MSLPNVGISNVVFHKDVEAIGTGSEFNVISGASVMNLQFITEGTFVAQIEVQVIDANKWYSYPSFKLPSYALMGSTITDENYIYQVDLTAISKVRVNLTAVDGEISVYGKVVS